MKFQNMDHLIATGFFLSIILIAAGSIKKVDLAKKLGLFFVSLLSILVYTTYGINDGSSHEDLFFVSSAMLSLTYLLSFIRKVPTVVRWILPIFFVGLFTIGLQEVRIGEYVVNFSDSKLWIFVTIAYVLAPISELKARILYQLFAVSELKVQRALSPLLLGIAVFASMFFYSNAGIFVVALGIAIWVFANNGRNNFLLPALGMLVAISFVGLGNLESIETLLGKNLEGLLFGISAALLCNVFASSEKRTVIGQILGISIGLLLAIALLFLGTQKTDFGGVDAFIAMIVGMSFTFFAIRETAWNSILFGGVVSAGLILIPFFYSQEEIDNKILIESKGVVEKVEEVDADPFQIAQNLAITDLSGAYQINEKSFKLNFELGPKGGRTKGKFKEIKGKVNLNGENSVFEVEMPSKALTTMNMYRDESLYGEGYFNVSKFTTMKFASKRLVQREGFYELEGDFIMLGKSKSQNVQLKYSGNSATGNPVFIGKGQIDRTQFGMTPDPKEGNIVDFSFEIELLKK